MSRPPKDLDPVTADPDAADPKEEVEAEVLPEPITLPEHGFVLVQNAEQLQQAVAELSGSTVLGVDTESDSFFSYRESCCLIQITGEGTRDFVIDPLRMSDLSPLAPLFADPEVTKIFHGADYDVVSIKRDFGFTVVNIFDTMIAAQASGHERFGLGDLVHRYFGETLNKKWQRHDWSARPLLEAHLDYARKDSHFLPRLREILLEQCKVSGRSAMITEEFTLLESREWTGRPYVPDDCLRVKGAARLTEDQRKVLRQIHALREGYAEDKNRPPFKIWGNDVCLQLAQEAPDSNEKITALLGEGHHVVRRFRSSLVQAIQRGKADTSAPPEPPKVLQRTNKGVPPFTRDDEPLLTALKKWRNQQSKTLRLAPGMIVNNHILKDVAALKPKTMDRLDLISEMRNWQKAEFGEALIAKTQAWLDKDSKDSKDSKDQGPRRRRRSRRRRSGGTGGGDAPRKEAPETSSTDS